MCKLRTSRKWPPPPAEAGPVWQICPVASTPKLSRLGTFGAGGLYIYIYNNNNNNNNNNNINNNNNYYYCYYYYHYYYYYIYMRVLSKNPIRIWFSVEMLKKIAMGLGVQWPVFLANSAGCVSGSVFLQCGGARDLRIWLLINMLNILYIYIYTNLYKHTYVRTYIHRYIHTDR